MAAPRYHVLYEDEAADQLRALPAKIQRQIGAKVDRLRDDPHPPGSKKLSGRDDLYRIRSGDYRILYAIVDQTLTVLVVKVGDRKDVYRNLP